MNKWYAIIFVSLFIFSCDNKPNTNKWKPPSKEQIACLKDVNKRIDNSMIEDTEEYLNELSNDESLIKTIIKQRRVKEILCIAKARCYETGQGIEFASCVEDLVPEQ